MAFGGSGNDSFIIIRTKPEANEARVVHKTPASGPINCIEWSRDSNTCFLGYQSGMVMKSYMGYKAVVGQKTWFSELVAKSQDAVVQLSLSSDGKRLLISTSSKTSLFDFENSSARPVGKQAVRVGTFGACYHPHLEGFFLVCNFCKLFV